MGLKASGEYEKRENIFPKDLVGKKFLVERVGSSTNKGKYPPYFPVEITVEGLGERVCFFNSVIYKQIEEADGLVGLTLTVVERESNSSPTGFYRALEEVSL